MAQPKNAPGSMRHRLNFTEKVHCKHENIHVNTTLKKGHKKQRAHGEKIFT